MRNALVRDAATRTFDEKCLGARCNDEDFLIQRFEQGPSNIYQYAAGEKCWKHSLLMISVLGSTLVGSLPWTAPWAVYPRRGRPVLSLPGLAPLAAARPTGPGY